MRALFEPAVAAAAGLFVAHAGATVATVVDVPVGVPVWLSVVRPVNGSRGWHESLGLE